MIANRYEQLQSELMAQPRLWLVTGVAGFIGSNLLETLLKLKQRVVGLDNFSTGAHANLDDVRSQVDAVDWARFTLIEGDIVDLATCHRAMRGVNIVLHQAALGSVPRSLADPIATHRANVDGFLNMLVAARDAGVTRFVYASSSSVYGDHPQLPKVEEQVGAPLSPYALSKSMNEQYAQVFARCYGFQSIGLRYFNVFGRRQSPEGAYAAVIPRWVGELLAGKRCTINGDGETSRDFCYIANTVQANLLAATVTDAAALDQVYNVAVAERTTLNRLYALIRDGLLTSNGLNDDQLRRLADLGPVYGAPRPGDVRHSLADISKAQTLLQYSPTHSVADGLAETLAWYVQSLRPDRQTSN